MVPEARRLMPEWTPGAVGRVAGRAASKSGAASWSRLENQLIDTERRNVIVVSRGTYLRGWGMKVLLSPANNGAPAVARRRERGSRPDPLSDPRAAVARNR